MFQQAPGNRTPLNYIMKNLLRNSFIVYLSIGGLLSIPMSISYMYAQWFVVISMGWGIFSISGLLAIMITGYLIVISPVIRAFIWLPSLIIWFNDPNSYNFWQWLAPGFFVSTSTG